MQNVIFRKTLSKIFEKYFFENTATFSCRGCQAHLSDMRTIILLLIMREEQTFLCKYVTFRKFILKFLKNIFSKISLHFLLEADKAFHLICDCYFNFINEGGAGIFCQRYILPDRDGPILFWDLLLILIPMVYKTPWLLE